MYQLILITCPNKKEATKIAYSLVKERLAACVNIIDKINSIFWWQGDIERSKETLLIIKSKRKQFLKIIKRVKELHSYKVPEIIAFNITDGERSYLKWIDESLGT